VLKLEGAKYNIKVNTIAPIAASRMTENLMPPEFLEKLKPEYVTPIVAYLCSEECEETGGIFSVGGGFFARIALMEGPGYTQKVDKPITLEDMRDNFEAIGSLENPRRPLNISEENQAIFANILK